MKITDVKAYYLEIPFDKPFRVATSPKVARKSEAFVLVKVFTDEGIVGIGAQRTPFPAWTKYIESSVRAFLLNEIVDPFYTEKFAIYYRSLALGTGVSPRPCCVEMALWDIVGKAAGQPVFKLLGAQQDRVKAYASVLEPYPQSLEFTKSLFDEGYRAIKLQIGWMWRDPKKVLEVIRAIRDELGYELEIMVDAMQSWEAAPLYDFRTALKYARGLEEYDVVWLEEPLPHFNNPDLSARLCAAVDIQIAGGGAMFGFHTYKTILEKGVLDIVQPDVQYAGGILEVKKIALLAEAYGKSCIPHYFGNGIGLAATLQVIGSTNIPYVEYPYHPPAWTVEFRDAVLKEPIRIDKDGYVKIPEKPGLGIELNEEVVKKYAV